MLSEWPGSKVIKDYKGGKSVVVIAHCPGMFHFIIVVILKNKNKVTEVVKGKASSKTMGLTKNHEGSVSDIEKLPMAWVGHHASLGTLTVTSKTKSLLVILKQKAGPNYITMLNLLSALVV